jgi:hypothetical protein
MTQSSEKNIEPVLSTGADAPMTAEQEETLHRLAQEALEHEAFSRRLTYSEAAERIEVLKAKITLMSRPPHTV